MKVRKWETILEILITDDVEDEWAYFYDTPVGKKIEEWLANGKIHDWELATNFNNYGGFRLVLYSRNQLTMDEAMTELRNALSIAQNNPKPKEE